MSQEIIEPNGQSQPEQEPPFIPIESFKVLVGDAVIIQQHPGCIGSTGTVTSVTTARDYKVTCGFMPEK